VILAFKVKKLFCRYGLQLQFIPRAQRKGIIGLLGAKALKGSLPNMAPAGWVIGGKNYHLPDRHDQ